MNGEHMSASALAVVADRQNFHHVISLVSLVSHSTDDAATATFSQDRAAGLPR